MTGQSAPGGSSGKRVSPVAMQKHLKGTNYPASKDDLVRQAEHNHAPDDILDAIRVLPADMFNGPRDVMRALGRSE